MEVGNPQGWTISCGVPNTAPWRTAAVVVAPAHAPRWPWMNTWKKSRWLVSSLRRKSEQEGRDGSCCSGGSKGFGRGMVPRCSWGVLPHLSYLTAFGAGTDRLWLLGKLWLPTSPVLTQGALKGFPRRPAHVHRPLWICINNPTSSGDSNGCCWGSGCLYALLC